MTTMPIARYYPTSAFVLRETRGPKISLLSLLTTTCFNEIPLPHSILHGALRRLGRGVQTFHGNASCRENAIGRAVA